MYQKVLENYHLASTFNIIQQDQTNIFAGCTKDARLEIRASIIDLVLATDFSRHLEVLGQFNSRRAAGGMSVDKRDDRLLWMKMALKCADISHTAKSTDIHLKWTEYITEEFFKQGDKERESGTTISPFMDRSKPEVPKSQCGFISFLVLPLYKAFAEEFSDADICVKHLEENLAHWKQKEEQR
jgi:cAMP-specific phosphodiesterase 4